MTATTPASRKAKGRKLQQDVASLIRTIFELSDLDVRSTSMGVSGTDIQMSSYALDIFPFAVECKCVEKVNLWEAWTQANNHSVTESRRTGKSINPLLVIRKSHKQPLVVLDLSKFLGFIKAFREAIKT